MHAAGMRIALAKLSLSAAQVLFILGNNSGDESDIKDPAFPLPTLSDVEEDYHEDDTIIKVCPNDEKVHVTELNKCIV